MARLRIGVLVDRMMLARWQADALRTLASDADFIVYDCRNSAPRKRHLRHAAYYLLNLFTVRNRMTRRVAWPADLPAVGVHVFDAPAIGGWQALPPDLIKQVECDRIEVIIKFGMGLLQVPVREELTAPILSYHHGDPAAFRGRPAGFYEILGDQPAMGQVVQILSNDLDAGELVAFAETKVFPHSYRSTLVEAYRHSPLLLRKAIANALQGRGWKPSRWGKNYRLPSNKLVARFLFKQWLGAIRHLLYGLFKEKRWQVATVPMPQDTPIEAIQDRIAQMADWQVLATPDGYRFLADPFFHPADGLLVEGFNERSCRGEILHLDAGQATRVSGEGGHFSYPATDVDGSRYNIIPEMSEWSAAKAYSLGPKGMGQPNDLKVPGQPALLDPTPFRLEGALYLFANRAEEGPSVLRLWVADDLAGQFTEHPASPIRISPRGARMAGHLFRSGGRLFRVGQDLRRGYGDGLSFFEVTAIDRDRYEETSVGDFRFEQCKGPHTLNFGDGRAAFDFYDERFNVLAGLGRLRERRAAKRSD